MAAKESATSSAKAPNMKALEKKAGVLNTKQMKQKDQLAKAKEELAATTTELRDVKAQIKAAKKAAQGNASE
jgi:septal ring factor EnvC (AmiA/AmiB activator)